MSDYAFVTIWRFNAPVEAVRRVLRDTGRWPQWWPYVARFDELEPGDPDGVGVLHHVAWKTPLCYALAFRMRTTAVERHRLILGHAKGNSKARDGGHCRSKRESRRFVTIGTCARPNGG